MQSILIGANAMGLASFWRSNGTESEDAKQHLGLDPESKIIGFIYIGYPDPEKTLNERARRPHTEFVKWLGWDGEGSADGDAGEDGR
jgi:nitroreductase